MSFWTMPLFMGSDKATPPADLSYIGNLGGNAAQNQTFSSVDFGAADTNRVIAVAICAYWSTGAADISSVMIGGSSATVLKRVSSPNLCAIAYRNVPAGTSGNIVVNFNQALSAFALIGAYRIVGTSPTPEDSEDINPGAVSSVSATLSGCTAAIFATKSTGNGPTITGTTNASIDLQANPASRAYGFGRVTDPTSTFDVIFSAATGGKSLIAVGWK